MKAVIGSLIIMSTIVVGCYSAHSLQYPTVIEKSSNSSVLVEQPTANSNTERVEIARAPASKSAPIPAPAPQPTIPSETVERQHTKPLLVPPRSTQVRPTQPQKTTEDWMSALRSANIVLTIPEVANINEHVRVELLLHLEKSIAELANSATEHGAQYGNSIRVSRITEVKLTAPAFDVNTITPSRQVLKDADINTWKWTLRPKSSGKHTVDITVLAVVEAEGVRVESTLVTFARQVQIEVTPQQMFSQWFAKYWQWLGSTIVIPLLLWWYKSRRKSSAA